MTPRHLISGLLIAAAATAALAACESRSSADLAEVRFQRVSAHRQACVARILAERADEDADLVASTVDYADVSDPVAEFTRRATLAALDFARAYQRHAELRVSAYAYLDSAVNHARFPSDSSRYIERAATYSIRLPAEGTIEANVLNRYQENMMAMISNPDHPCNWNHPY